jgi:hypothetical protein
MPKTHPHAEATYRVMPLDDGSFGVEVRIPDSQPTTVRPFASERDAEAWIADHRRRVQAQTPLGGWFRRSGGRGGG